MHGDDLAVFSLAIGIGIPFAWDAVKERGWRRWAATILSAIFVLFALFWLPLKAGWPELANLISHVATNLQTWVFFAFAGLTVFLATSPALLRLDDRRQDLAESQRADISWREEFKVQLDQVNTQIGRLIDLLSGEREERLREVERLEHRIDAVNKQRTKSR